MKKQKLKNLALNKKVISKLNAQHVVGGNTRENSCPPYSACSENCPPPTFTHCPGGQPCVNQGSKHVLCQIDD